MTPAAPVVVKLGGSLLADSQRDRLHAWGAALGGELAGRCIVVPGGGPFADAVRDAQARWHFSRDAAHRMALMAMNQCGLMLADLFPALVAEADESRLAPLCRRGVTPVWLPLLQLETSDALPRDWHVTSDSIAAWLAHRLGTRAVLVKSCAVSTRDIDALAAAGVVDAHLPALVRRTGVRVSVIGDDTPPSLAENDAR